MARLGHASARAAKIYQHATEDRDRLIADRLTAMTVEAGLATVLPITGRHESAQDSTGSPIWHGSGTNGGCPGTLVVRRSR